ncbi:unnamed protein product [Bursaphelenchus okinawaensis]|uniref:G-protein coupled receptors family 1 profile domain-containing protein n=1 Tax=Bursaphelenchus okinawaensis TaxID=465554 RepID=A0A811KUD3_9BILA|nr:unnamed protein product [Bursaphelenchus okinawaensis]CAG9111139.1 unnamed protein product [Bursaphelenchus okinawaensis]
MDITNFSTELNVTEECVEEYENYEEFEKWLLGVVALPFIMVGLAANFMSLLIFSHKNMRTNMVNWYLMILAASDSVILISSFIVLTLPRLGEILHFWKLTWISYYLVPYWYAPMGSAQTISVWMTVAMSLHRFIGVCLPFKASILLNKKRAKVAIGSVIVFAIMFNMTRFFEVEIVSFCRHIPINAELPIFHPTPLRLSSLYRQLYYEYAYTLVMFLIPFTILIMVNSMVILAIHKSRQIHAKLNVYDDGTRKQEIAKEISTSIMLVAIVVAFLLCNTLTFVVNILENWGYANYLTMLVPWSNWLVMTNASINICIYCMFSDKYRQLFWYYLRLLGCCGCRNDFEVIVNHTWS